MVGGDFETVRGEWGVRGEVAAYPDRRLQGRVQARLFDGHTIEGGVGADRSAGAYRVSGNIVVARRWLSDRGGTDAADRVIDRTDVNLVGAVDRSFARETRRIRVFGVYNPEEASAFVRAIAGFDVRDNVAIEASGGVFAGDGADALSRLATRDFVYLRLKVFF
jgi:hypothetical protein